MYHEGESLRRIGRRLDISLHAVQLRIQGGELKLAALKEL